MGKSKDEQARREGMAYALRIAKENGIDALEADLRWRNVGDIPVGLEKAVVDDFQERVKYNTVDTIKILACVTLRDEFGFGKDRLKRFAERFMLKTECLADDYTNWQEQIDILREECGLEFTIRKNE